MVLRIIYAVILISSLCLSIGFSILGLGEGSTIHPARTRPGLVVCILFIMLLKLKLRPSANIVQVCTYILHVFLYNSGFNFCLPSCLIFTKLQGWDFALSLICYSLFCSKSLILNSDRERFALSLICYSLFCSKSLILNSDRERFALVAL